MEIIPCAASPPTTPFTCHVTAVFGVLATVAVNCCCWPACTLAVAGATLTVMGSVTGGAVAKPAQPARTSTATTNSPVLATILRATSAIAACGTRHFSGARNLFVCGYSLQGGEPTFGSENLSRTGMGRYGK